MNEQVALTEDLPETEREPLAPKRGGAQKKALRITKKILIYAALLLLAVFFLFPFFVMFCISILTDAEVFQQVLFSPTGTIELGNYTSIFSAGSNYMRYLGNTLQVAAILTIGIPLVSSMCAFGFSKLHFHGRNVVYSIVLGTLMIPSVITLIPLYTIYAKLGWLNSLLPLWVPSLFGGGATNIFLMRQFMRGIPNDLLDAAQIDGANIFRIYVTVALPLCVPILLYVGYQSFVGAWNNFIGPMTYLDSGSKFTTLALGMYIDFGPVNNNAYANSAMAAGVVMTLPCIVLFIFFQKYLIEGVAVTGLKA